MTRLEICCRISEMRDNGVKVFMIASTPEKGLPSPAKVRKGLELNLSETGILEMDGFYAATLARFDSDDHIDRVVDKIFEKAKITSAWGVFFC